MKTNQFFKHLLLLLLFLLTTNMTASAYNGDFTAENELGQTIYYKILDDNLLTVEVAQHNSYNSPYMGQYGELANQDVIIPSTVENDGKTYTVVAIGDYAFHAGTVRQFDGSRTDGIKSIVLPNTIKSIGKEAFSQSTNLIAVTLSEGLTSIGDKAFHGCTSLFSIVLPSTMQTIGASVFGTFVSGGKMSLKSVVVKGSHPAAISGSTFPDRSSQTLYVPAGCLSTYAAADYWKDFKELVENSRITFADANVETICVQNWDQDGDGYLDKIEAASVTDLGTAFLGKTQITSFNELSYFTGLTTIRNQAFSGCTSLTAIAIPSNVKTIGDNAFAGCSSLPTVVLPTSLTAIGNYAFSGCSSLPTVVLPTSLTAIGKYAFSGCSSLATITSLNNVTTIGASAFANCTSLVSVSVNAATVGSNTFSGCTNLSEVTFGSKVADIKRHQGGSV